MRRYWIIFVFFISHSVSKHVSNTYAGNHCSRLFLNEQYHQLLSYQCQQSTDKWVYWKNKRKWDNKKHSHSQPSTRMNKCWTDICAHTAKLSRISWLSKLAVWTSFLAFYDKANRHCQNVSKHIHSCIRGLNPLQLFEIRGNFTYGKEKVEDKNAILCEAQSTIHDDVLEKNKWSISSYCWSSNWK